MLKPQRVKTWREKAFLLMFSWGKLFHHLGERKQLLDKSIARENNKATVGEILYGSWK